MRDTRDDPEIDPKTWAMLRALRGGARISRNRHFFLFEDPKIRRALKVHRYLQSIIRDVEACDTGLQVTTIDDEMVAGRFALRLDFPRLNGHRTAYLTALEMRLLGEEAPEIARRLSALA